MAVSFQELVHLQDEHNTFDLSVLKSMLEFVLVDPTPNGKLLAQRPLCNPDNLDVFGFAPVNIFEADDLFLRGVNVFEPLTVCTDVPIAFSHQPSMSSGYSSGYSSLLSTPHRPGSRAPSESHGSGVVDQLFNWNPSLPTTPASPRKSASRRSHSAESPKKTQVGAPNRVAVRRQLFSSSSSQNINSNVEAKTDAQTQKQIPCQSNAGNGGTAAINPSKYKTMHCRNFSAKGVCEYGQKCQFAHGSGELRVQANHPKFKTEMCRNFEEFGFCEWRDACIFRHGSNDLINPKLMNKSKKLNRESDDD